MVSGALSPEKGSPVHGVNMTAFDEIKKPRRVYSLVLQVSTWFFFVWRSHRKIEIVFAK